MPHRASRPGLPPGPCLILGLARSGVAASLALRARGVEVVGADSGEPAVEELRAASIPLHLNTPATDLLDSAQWVVKSPGVPAHQPAVALARDRGLVVMGELELAWRLLSNEFVAITGTNGKTTTTEWVGHIHRVAGRPVAVAGNVGTAVSGLVGVVDAAATVVCECSSFQLEDAIEFAPEVAALLNVSDDHLDRHETLEDYLGAKLRIFANQAASDIAVLPAGFGAPDGRGLEAQLGVARREVFGPGVPAVGEGPIGLPGAHNRSNALAAAAICLARGIEEDAIAEGLRSFPGVPHRLETIAVRRGVRWVNDSKATNVASTLVALESFAGEGIVLILGGQGKDQDFRALRDAVEARTRRVLLIGEDAPKIGKALKHLTPGVTQCGDLERAVAAATRLAHKGETVLLSPACASFDQFASFEDRGERFRALVAAL